MVHPTANSRYIIPVHTLSGVSFKTLALRPAHQNAQKMSTFSKTFIVEVSLQTWILKAARPSSEIAGTPSIFLINALPRRSGPTPDLWPSAWAVQCMGVWSGQGQTSPALHWAEAVDVSVLPILPPAPKMGATRFGGFGLAFTLTGGLKLWEREQSWLQILSWPAPKISGVSAPFWCGRRGCFSPRIPHI